MLLAVPPTRATGPLASVGVTEIKQRKGGCRQPGDACKHRREGVPRGVEE